MKTLNTKKLGTVGIFGEDAALDYLLKAGYELVGRNVVCAGKEIDIIVRDMRYIVFVEVKTRTKYNGISRYGSAASAVNHDKQAHIITAARQFLQENYHRRIPRFDVIEVYIEHTEIGPKIININHIPRAFGTRR